MAFAVETFFGEDRKENKKITDEGSQSRETGDLRSSMRVRREGAQEEAQDPEIYSDGIPESELEDD